MKKRPSDPLSPKGWRLNGGAWGRAPSLNLIIDMEKSKIPTKSLNGFVQFPLNHYNLIIKDYYNHDLRNHQCQDLYRVN